MIVHKAEGTKIAAGIDFPRLTKRSSNVVNIDKYKPCMYKT